MKSIGIFIISMFVIACVVFVGVLVKTVYEWVEDKLYYSRHRWSELPD